MHVNSSTPHYEAHLNMDITRFTTFKLLTCSSWSASKSGCTCNLARPLAAQPRTFATYLCHTSFTTALSHHFEGSTSSQIGTIINWKVRGRYESAVFACPTSICLDILNKTTGPARNWNSTYSHPHAVHRLIIWIEHHPVILFQVFPCKRKP